MATKKPKLTDEQIVNFITTGGNPEDLYKKANVTSNQILAALVNNPKAFSYLQGEAKSAAEGLDSFVYDPNSSYQGADRMPETNPYSEGYKLMGPAEAKFAEDYNATLFSIGNNPALKEDLKTKFLTEVAPEFGLDEKTANALTSKLDADSDKWYSAEVDRQRREKEKEFAAYKRQREDLKIGEGQSPLEATFKKLTGFGALAKVPSPDISYEQLAKRAATQNVPSSSIEAIKKLPQAQGVVGSKEQTTAVKDMERKRKEYETMYLKAVKKTAGAKATPYSQGVKKILPYLQATNPFGK